MKHKSLQHCIYGLQAKVAKSSICPQGTKLAKPGMVSQIPQNIIRYVLAIKFTSCFHVKIFVMFSQITNVFLVILFFCLCIFHRDKQIWFPIWLKHRNSKLHIYYKCNHKTASHIVTINIEYKDSKLQSLVQQFAFNTHQLCEAKNGLAKCLVQISKPFRQQIAILLSVYRMF